VAFFTYEYVAGAFSTFIDSFSGANWYAVDGGALQAKVMAPAINGVIVPATSLLYATLASTTISTLRQRQLQMREAINLEAGELRTLSIIVAQFPKGRTRDISRTCVQKYTARLVAECAPRVTKGDDVVDPRRGMETELNAFLKGLYKAYGDGIPAHLADQSLAAIGKLREYRLQRVSALQSTYPVLHYATLIALALAECAAFLLETNQDLVSKIFYAVPSFPHFPEEVQKT